MLCPTINNAGFKTLYFIAGLLRQTTYVLGDNTLFQQISHHIARVVLRDAYLRPKYVFGPHVIVESSSCTVYIIVDIAPIDILCITTRDVCATTSNLSRIHC